MRWKTRQRSFALARLCLLLVLSASACQQGPAQDSPPTAAVDASLLGDRFNPAPGLITWTRDANEVLFRAEIVGGEDPFLARSIVPECTIYGDNRIVWQNMLDSADVQVLEDRLSDQTISAFVQYLTVGERIYTFTEKLPEVAAQYDTAPVVEHVTINVNGILHRADGLSGWDSTWFDRVLATCQGLGAAPVLVLPSQAWVNSREVSYDPQPALILWDAAATGIRLGAYTGDTPGWVEGDGVRQLWNRARGLPLNSLYREDGRTYQIALQVPGVTRGSPPPPTSP
ncbi:MAG: hypothetical protein L6Q98_04980 [Anaerolineae bacterium]|nr:hypothetical protein [Anaerolineae bacterium]NUQ05224.1 hypothetical protein [Anaerolineae bacterium]